METDGSSGRAVFGIGMGLWCVGHCQQCKRLRGMFCRAAPWSAGGMGVTSVRDYPSEVRRVTCVRRGKHEASTVMVQLQVAMKLLMLAVMRSNQMFLAATP